MKLLDFFAFARARSRTAPVARERLQILLTHERSGDSHSDLVNVLREEVLAVIGKHVSIDPEKVEVRLDRGKAVSTLEIEIELPTPEKRRAAPAAPAKAAKTGKKRGKAA